MTLSPAPSMEELIEKLERASGPDRELDARIHCLLFPDFAYARRIGRHKERFIELIERAVINEGENFGNWLTECWPEVPHYTGSLDAAMTLVQPNWHIEMLRFSDGWYVTVAPKSTADVKYNCTQKPAAIALVIASLKAMKTE